MAFVAAVPVVAESVSKPTTQSFLMKLILMPVVIICVILIIASLIAVGNGAYTMGTLITFIIGAGGLVGYYYMTKIPSEALQGPQGTPQGYYGPPPGYGYQQPQPMYRQQPRQLGYATQPPRRRSNPQLMGSQPNVPRPRQPQYAQARQSQQSTPRVEGEGEEYVADEVDVKKENKPKELIE